MDSGDALNGQDPCRVEWQVSLFTFFFFLNFFSYSLVSAVNGTRSARSRLGRMKERQETRGICMPFPHKDGAAHGASTMSGQDIVRGRPRTSLRAEIMPQQRGRDKSAIGRRVPAPESGGSIIRTRSRVTSGSLSTALIQIQLSRLTPGISAPSQYRHLNSINLRCTCESKEANAYLSLSSRFVCYKSFKRRWRTHKKIDSPCHSKSYGYPSGRSFE